ncbi:MAG: hypothetical protein E2O67_05155 [Deltaproteobacteria bacterium]|nr:MAG: hypothetical protein E2O67_05155 [Deltaproteobacteria bacterium]
MSNGNDDVQNFSSDQRAINILDRMLVTKDFDTDDRQYIRLNLIPMLTRAVENLDDGFNEELRDMAINLCMKLIPYDYLFLRFVEDWITKKQQV